MKQTGSNLFLRSWMILSLAVIVAVSLANPSLAAEESEADIQAYVKDMQPGWESR